MNTLELRDLVKSHFNLVEAEVTTVEEVAVVEETFGRIADEDKSFEIEFPGDSMQIGDKVTVVTPDDQKLDAPDGEHRLEDGTRIVTKDSVITEIHSASGDEALAEEKMTEEVGEETFDARTDAEEEGYLDGIADEKADEKKSAMADVEEIVKAIVSEVKDELSKMSTKMAEMEGKIDGLENAPAAESTKMNSKPASKAKFTAFNIDGAANADRIKAVMAQLKSKNK